MYSLLSFMAALRGVRDLDIILGQHVMILIFQNLEGEILAELRVFWVLRALTGPRGSRFAVCLSK